MIKLLIVITGAFLAVSGLRCHGQTLDYSAASQSKDNFLEARFRFVNPDPQKIPTVILVYIPGTDGDARGIVEDPKFLATCRVCHAALLGCCFRGEGLDYDLPSGGSGQALDKAIFYFAMAIGYPELTKVPLLLFGHSQGAQFVFNYLCWRPQRVKAFAAIKPGYFQLDPQEASFKIPGVIVAGENDESGRIRTASKAFSGAVGKHSRWAFLLEKDAGHELARSGDFARQFFESVCRADVKEEPILMGPETGNPPSLSSATFDLCWFPNQHMADTWKLLHKPALLQDLISLPDRPGLSGFISATVTPDHYECKNDASESGMFDLSTTRQDVEIDRIYITGSGFTMQESKGDTLPKQIKIQFAPQALAWGNVGGNIVIEGKINGHSAEPLEVRLSGIVKGPLIPFPSLVYLGVAKPGQMVSQTVLLKSDGKAVQVTSIKVSDDMTVTIDPKAETNHDLRLHILWLPRKRYGSMFDEIRLRLDSPQNGELRIPVIGMVSKLDE